MMTLGDLSMTVSLQVPISQIALGGTFYVDGVACIRIQAPPSGDPFCWARLTDGGYGQTTNANQPVDKVALKVVSV